MPSHRLLELLESSIIKSRLNNLVFFVQFIFSDALKLFNIFEEHIGPSSPRSFVFSGAIDRENISTTRDSVSSRYLLNS